MSFGYRVRLNRLLRNHTLRSLLLFALVIALVGVTPTKDFFQRTTLEYIAPGVRYYHFMEPVGPVNLDVVRITRGERLISLQPMMGKGSVFGVQPVSKMVESISGPPKYPIAAVNGDFYKLGKWEGMTLGPVVIDHEIITTPPLKNDCGRRPSFVIYSSGKPDIFRLGYRGRIVIPGPNRYELLGVNRPRSTSGFILYTPKFGKTTPYEEGATDVVVKTVTGIQKRDSWKLRQSRKYRGTVTSVRNGGGTKIPRNGAVLGIVGASGLVSRDLRAGSKIKFWFERVEGRSEVKLAISGWPVIVENGKNAFKPGKGARHPRTVIGYNKKEIFLAVIDGRRGGWSRGMSNYEMGELMLRMNCTEAINLDGGGSSTMWVRGKLRNKVSDGRERSVSNGLAVLLSAPRTGRLQRLAIVPSELALLTNNNIEMRAVGQDKYYNPVPMSGSPQWDIHKSIGSISPDGVFTSGSREAKGKISVRFGGLKQSVDVKIYSQPPILQIFPKVVNMFEGESLQFRYLAMDHSALPVTGDYSNRLHWTVTPGLGQIDSNGFFKAGNVLAKGDVMLRSGNIARIARVTVGTVPKLVDGFEKLAAWKFVSHPKDKLPGNFAITRGAAYRGNRGGELRYRFDQNYPTEAAYAKTRPLDIGKPMGVRVWVKGNGASHQLRMAYRDRGNQRNTVPFTDGTLANTQWHSAVARIPPDEKFPITLESIYVLRNDETTLNMSGTIYFDEVTGLYVP